MVSRPVTWASSELAVILSVLRNGFSCKQSKDGKGLPVTRIETIADGTVNLSRVGYAIIPEESRLKYRLESGDILFSHINSLQHIGKAAIFRGDDELYHGMNLLLLRPVANLMSPDFVAHFLRTKDVRLYYQRECKRAINQVSLNTSDVGRLEIPIPPLPEQRRIVAKIESCFSKIDATERTLDKIESFLTKYQQSVLAKAFRGQVVPQNPNDESVSRLLERIRAESAKQQAGKKKQKDELPSVPEDKIPFGIPKSWEWVRLGDLLHFQNGHSFKASEWAKRGLPIIRIQNLNRNGGGEFNYFNGKPAEEWVVRGGDLLFAWSGSKGVSFGAHIWNGPTGVLNQHIFKVTPKCGVEKLYLFWLLRQFQSSIEDRAHGFKETFVHVKQSDLKRVIVPLPPSFEQKRIADALEAATSQIDCLSTTMKGVRENTVRLSNSVLSFAFSGCLATQDPSEGTGQELLDRILEERNRQDDNNETSAREPLKAGKRGGEKQ